MQEANKVETEEADPTLYMHEVVLLNEEKVIPKNYETAKKEEGIWYLDNGASNHMTGNRSYFTELNENIKGKVKFGDDSCVEICGRGSILFQNKADEQKLVTDIYYIPNLKSSILSLGQATEAGCEVKMRQDYLTLHDSNGRLLVKVKRSPNRLYKTSLTIGQPTCLQSRIDDDTWRWHARLGHISFKTVKTISEQGMVRGLPSIRKEGRLCESCLVGKQTRQPFPKASMFRASRPLELIHADLCGPITPPTIAHNKYIFVIIDDFSRYMWTILIKEKSDAFERFKALKSLVEKDLGKAIMTLRTDRGGEFTSREFNEFCDISGIKRHLTAPYTPQQNGVVERRNRTLLEMTRSILKAMNVPNYRKEEGETLLIVAIYVDDLFVTGNTLKVISEFKKEMSSKFEMTDLGKLTYYLGIEVHQTEEGIEVKQEGYALKILKEAGLESCNHTQVPMEFGLKVSKAQDEAEIDPTSYRRNVGCLRYLLHTRPDLTFSVGVASRYMQSPRKSHGEMIKHILRYLKGTINFGLRFGREGSRKITGFSDSSHNRDQDDGRRTTAHVFYFG